MGKKSAVRPSIGEGKVTKLFMGTKNSAELEKKELNEEVSDIVEEQGEKAEEKLGFDSELDVAELLDNPPEEAKSKYTFSLPFYTLEQIDKLKSWVSRRVRARIPMSAVVAVCVEYTARHLGDKEDAMEILKLFLEKRKDFGKKKK